MVDLSERHVLLGGTTKHQQAMRSLIYTLIIILLFHIKSFSTCITACMASGDWGLTSTWDLARLPSAPDTVVIPVGRTVSLDATVVMTGAPVIILVYGEFYFPNGRKITLPSGSKVYVQVGGKLTTGGGGGTNERITIGSTLVWTAGCGCGSCVPSPDCGNVPGYQLLQEVPLPVTLLSFNGECSGEEVVLKWTTANENHFSGYVISEAKNGEWTDLNFIEGGKSFYEWKIENQSTGVFQLNGKNTDGSIVSLGNTRAKCSSDKSYFYNSETKTIKLYSGSKLELLDSWGKILLQSESELTDLSTFIHGVYIIRIYSDDEVKSEKITL